MFCFLCFVKVYLSRSPQVGTEHGLGALQHSLWPKVCSNHLAIWTKALWVLSKPGNFHPDRQLFKLPAPEIELLTLRLQGQCFTPTPGELTNLIDISKTLNFRAVSRHAHRSSRLGCLSSLTLGNINNGSKKQNIFVPVSFSLTALQSHLLLLLLLERTGIHEFQYCCLPYFL